MIDRLQRVDKSLTAQSFRHRKLVTCRWCGAVITDKKRRTFCGEACVHEFKLRTNPGYVREAVFKRDLGVCAACGLDTAKLYRVLKCFNRVPCATDLKKVPGKVPAVSDFPSREDYYEALRDWNGRNPGLFDASWYLEAKRTLIALGFVTQRGRHKGDLTSGRGFGLWAADHIVPVVEGGGLCGLEGYRTLCHPCHDQVTAELSARRAARVRRIKAAIKHVELVRAANRLFDGARSDPRPALEWLADKCRGGDLIVDKSLKWHLDHLHPTWTTWVAECRVLLEAVGDGTLYGESPDGLAALARLAR